MRSIMAYSKNPGLPKVRGQAVELVRRGWSVRKTARHLGYSHSAVVKWCAKARIRGHGSIPTLSSRPKSHPRALDRNIVGEIIKERIGRHRCAEHVYHALKNKGVPVSLSSVKRTLDRCHLRKKRSPWKRPHDFTQRPEAAFAGALVELDTIHFMGKDRKRTYVYTIIDLYSRFAYAEVAEKINTRVSVAFVKRAQQHAPFVFKMIQTDHGPEFQKLFRFRLAKQSIMHRYSRVRQKDDQAHIERFNRTIQEECLDKVTHTMRSFKVEIPKYLTWYNTKRTHMGINYQTPLQMVPSY